MGDFGRVEAGTGVRLYSSAEEIEGPNACFATDAVSSSPPATSAVMDEGAIERVKTGSLTPRPGETYEQCVNRYRNATTQSYKGAGLFGGCITGGIAGAVAGAPLGPPGVVIGAGLGCTGGALTGAIVAAGPGAASGEAEGKVACDGLTGWALCGQPCGAYVRSLRLKPWWGRFSC